MAILTQREIKDQVKISDSCSIECISFIEDVSGQDVKMF